MGYRAEAKGSVDCGEVHADPTVPRFESHDPLPLSAQDPARDTPRRGVVWRPHHGRPN